jgi:hypothetical protein
MNATEHQESPLPSDLVIESSTDDEAQIRTAYGLHDEPVVDTPVAETPADDAPVEEPVVEPPARAGGRIDAAADAATRKTKAQSRKDEIQTEINDLTRQKHESKREADAAKRELDALRAERATLSAAAPAAAVVAPAAVAVVEANAPQPQPQIEDFEDLSEYQTAISSWATEEAGRAARVAVQSELTTERARLSTESATRAKEQARATYNAQLVEVKAAHDDFDTLMAEHDLAVSQVMEAAILTSPKGAEITYYLLQHPEDAASLTSDTAAIGPEGLSLVRRSLESRLSAAPSKTGPAAVARRTTTETPEPISPVSTGSPASTMRLDQLSPEDYMRVRNKEENEKAGRL